MNPTPVWPPRNHVVHPPEWASCLTLAPAEDDAGKILFRVGLLAVMITRRPTPKCLVPLTHTAIQRAEAQ